MKTRLMICVCVALFMGMLAFGQTATCVAVDPLFLTINPVPQGGSTALCSKISNCGPHDRQFKVEFTADTPCGEHLILDDPKVAIGAGQTIIICCTDTLTNCVGDQTVTMTVSAGNLQLASTSATLTVVN